MAALTAEDVGSWDLARVDRELNARLDDVRGIRERNGDTLVGLTGDDAERVREHMASTNLLGQRRDEMREQEKGDQQFDRLAEYMSEPDPAHRHPGHGKGRAAEPQKARDIGGMFVESDAWKAFKADGRKDVEVSLPLASLWPDYQGIGEFTGVRPQAALFDSTGFPTPQDFRMPPLPVLYQQNNIGTLMPQGSTDRGVVRYFQEVVTATGAAAVAEGAAKPEAQLTFTAVDENVRKIAVLLPVTDEGIEDNDFLRSWINARLRLFVQNEEDRELLLGSGTAPEIKGIMNRSGINTATSYSIGGANPDQALVDACFHAAMRVRDSFLEPDAAVMKPSVWEIAALAKDGNRNYLLGGPGASGYAGNDPVSGPRLWGLRVVLNTNMPAQSATNKVVLVGAFQTAAMVIRRSGAGDTALNATDVGGGITLAVSDSHGTFFAENKIMIRAEERLALAVWRPAGFATVTSAA